MPESRPVGSEDRRPSVTKRGGYQGSSDPGEPTMLMQPPIRRRTESEVEAYVEGYRAAIDTVLRTAGLELSPATAEKIKAFAEIVGTGV